MTARIVAALSMLGCVCIVAAQTQAPPPNAKDTSIPPRPMVPAGAADTTISSGTLTASDAVRIEIARQPTLEAVRQAVIAAEGRITQLRASLLPHFGLTGNYGSTRYFGNEFRALDLNYINGSSGAAVVTQLLFDANHSSDLVRQSAALKSVAVQDLARAKADLTLQVLVGYYLVGEAHQLVAVNERNVENRDSQLQLAVSRFNSGLGGPDDVLTAQTAKGDAVVALVQARTTEDTARMSLMQTLGVDPQTPFKIGDEGAAPVIINKYDDFVTLALSRRPEVLRAKAAIDAAKFGARAAKTTSAPVLSGSLNVNSSDPGFPAANGTYGLGLLLTVPVFDGNLTAGAVKEAQAVLKSAQSDLATAQLQVRTDVSQAYLAVRGAEQQSELSKTNVDNAKESLRIAEGRYKSGVGLFLDIINAQAALLTAETNAATALAEVSRQRATLERAAGMLTNP